VDGDELVEVLLTRYPPGAGIGWHRDAPMFGPEVVHVPDPANATPASGRLRVDQRRLAWSDHVEEDEQAEAQGPA
jgi:hypothetical protein